MSARRWLIGLVTGALVGVGTLVAGPLAGAVGLVGIVLATGERPRQRAIGGVLVGLGGAWLALFGRAALTCREGCLGPDLTPWLLAAAGLLALGSAVSIRASRRPG